MTTTPTFWGTQVTFSFDPLAFAPDVSARPDNTFVLVWGDDFGDLHGRHLSSLGSFTSGDFLLSMSSAETRELRLPEAVSLPDGTTRVFFHLLFSPSEEDVYVNFPNSDFTGQTTRFPVVNTAQDEFLSDAAPTEFNNAPGSAMLYRVPKLGSPGSDLWFAHIAFNGLVIGSPIPIPTAANESVISAKLAGLGNGNTIIVYHVFNSDTSQTFARYRVYDDYTDVTGAQDAAATPGNDVFPAVCGLKNSSNGFVVVTQDALGLRYLYSAFGNSFTASVPGSLGSGGGLTKAISPLITPLEDQGFIIAWTDTSGTEGDGSANLKVVLQRFGSNGLPIGDNVIIDNPGDQSLSSIATLDDGRVIVTYSNETGDSTNLTTLAYRIVDPREKIIFGSSTPDNITSREDGATLFGFDNNDVLLGRNGADTLNGGTGLDEMRGEGGNDAYEVDNAGDQVIESAGQGYDTVNSVLNTYTLGPNVERANFIGLGNFLGIGNGLNNRFSGGAGSDRFIDVAGGADIFGGGQGADTVDFRMSSSGVVLNFLTDVHGGAALGDFFASIEKFLGSATGADRMSADAGGRVVFAGYGGDDRLNGNLKNDQLLGGAGDDILQGKAGPDTLDGGTGDDTLAGGADGDVFVFVDAAFGQDTITDYQDGLDSFKVFSAVADNIADFTITGNGTASVRLTLAASPANFITINSAAAITIAADDFVFY